jgi:glyoxylase-like metal-dependent hydrolase (beta-lactamase superfamily II)
VLTHLHCEHIGGLPSFPDAQVHLFAPELVTANRRRGLFGRFYEPAHWRHGPKKPLYDDRQQLAWCGFNSIRLICTNDPISFSRSQPETVAVW